VNGGAGGVPDRRRLSDEDIERICEALARRQGHVCRFVNITPEQVEETIRFQRHVNTLVTETGSTIWKTIIVAGVGGMISLLVLGLYAKIKDSLGL